MKYLILLIALCSASLVQAETIHACKKRHPLVYTSYTWAEIEQANDGQIHFVYGNGIDTQMIEVQFDSVVYEVAPNQYQSNEPDYELAVNVKNGMLDYTIKSGGKTTTKTKFQCL